MSDVNGHVHESMSDVNVESLCIILVVALAFGWALIGGDGTKVRQVKFEVSAIRKRRVSSQVKVREP